MFKIDSLYNLLPTNSLRRHLVQSASGSLVLKMSAMGLQLILSIFLARTLGVEQFGIYVFCLSIVNIFSVVATLGGQQFLVREVASYNTKRQFHLLRGLILRFRQAIIFTSLLIIIIVGIIGFWLYEGSQILYPFLVALFFLPFQATIQIQGAILQGLRHILLGQLSKTLRPALVLIFFGIIFFFFSQRADAKIALSTQLLAGILLVSFTFILVNRKLPKETKSIDPEFETIRWFRCILPFMFATGMQTLNNEISIALLGILQDSESVGLYRAAQRGADVLLFGLMAVNLAMGPSIAELYVKKENRRLQNMLHKSVWAVLAFAAPVIIFFILWGDLVLVKLFGREFVSSYAVLIVICCGQIANIAVGSVALILNMIGYESFTAKGVAVATLANILFAFILIPQYGVFGAGLATALSLVIWNLLLAYWLYKETGILSSPLFKAFGWS